MTNRLDDDIKKLEEKLKSLKMVCLIERSEIAKKYEKAVLIQLFLFIIIAVFLVWLLKELGAWDAI
jgi:small basic protein